MAAILNDASPSFYLDRNSNGEGKLFTPPLVQRNKKRPYKNHASLEQRIKLAQELLDSNSQSLRKWGIRNCPDFDVDKELGIKTDIERQFNILCAPISLKFQSS
jgi:hypothetical protein